MLDIKLAGSSDVVTLAGRFDGAGAVAFDQQLRPMENRPEMIRVSVRIEPL